MRTTFQERKQKNKLLTGLKIYIYIVVMFDAKFRVYSLIFRWSLLNN